MVPWNARATDQDHLAACVKKLTEPTREPDSPKASHSSQRTLLASDAKATIMSQGFGQGGQGSNQRCDATCHRAKHPRCVCICRGRYHGKGSSEAAQQQLTRDWLGDDWQERVAAAQRAEPGLTKAQAAFRLYERRIAAKKETMT